MIFRDTLLAIAACLLWSSAFVWITTGLPYTLEDFRSPG